MTADVYAYDKEIVPLNDVPIVSGATAWDDTASGQVFILVINEALYYGTKLDHSLIKPNQIRAYGVPFWDNPYDKERGLTIEVDDTVNIQMNTMGTKIQFETRSPKNKELRKCPKLNLTGKNEWNPSSVSLGSADSTREKYKNQDLNKQLIATIPRTISKTTRFDDALEDIPTRQTYSSTDRHSKISAEVLADRFRIGIDRSNATIKATLQR